MNWIFAFGIVIGTAFLLAFSLAIYDWMTQVAVLTGWIARAGSNITWEDAWRQLSFSLVLGIIAILIVASSTGAFKTSSSSSPPGFERGVNTTSIFRIDPALIAR